MKLVKGIWLITSQSGDLILPQTAHEPSARIGDNALTLDVVIHVRLRA